MLHSFLKASRLKCWLSRPDCPQAIKECKILFNQLTSPTTMDTCSQESNHMTPTPREGHSARIKHDGVFYTLSATHPGNCLVLYVPGGDATASLVPGQIFDIITQENVTTFKVRRFMPPEDGTIDPFKCYINLPIKLYSSNLDPILETVQLDWVAGHFAKFPVSDEHIAVLSLSRVRSNSVYLVWLLQWLRIKHDIMKVAKVTCMP